MSRYIDADALDIVYEDGDMTCVRNLDAMPTVDAVLVVRCAQCKWWWKVNGLCTHPKHCHDNVCVHECGKDYFCADGERKDGERRTDEQ